MPAAARSGDRTSHPGVIAGPGVASVLIAGRPAAVIGTKHACARPGTGGPHPPSPIVTGSARVLIGGKPAARVGDLAGCGAAIQSGARNVIIGG